MSQAQPWRGKGKGGEGRLDRESWPHIQAGSTAGGNLASALFSWFLGEVCLRMHFQTTVPGIPDLVQQSAKEEFLQML